MQQADLDDSIRYLKGVGEKRAGYFKKLDVETVYDLLHFYPRDYLDFSSPTPIDGLEPDNTYCIKAVVHYNPTEN